MVMGLLPMGADILPPSDDRVFKLILTAEEARPVLTDLISAVINRPVVDVIVRNNEIPPWDTREKAERLDLNCRIDDGSQIDMEMEASHREEANDGEHQNVKGKCVYYLCDLHSSQPCKGSERYDKLARTYQVTFCTYTVFPHRTGYLNSFSLRHDEDNGLLTDAIHVVFVELSKLGKVMKKPVRDMTDLEKWAVFFRYASDAKHREALNKVIDSKEELPMAGSLLISISQDERERAVFRSRRMAETDRLSDLATARDKGRQEGIQEGIQKGEAAKALSMARAMVLNGEPIEKIVQYTGLLLEDVEKLKI